MERLGWWLALPWLFWTALAVRPEEKAYSSVELASDSKSSSRHEVAKQLETKVQRQEKVLPKSCNEEGVIQLEPHSVYHTCPSEHSNCTDLEKPKQWHKLDDRCKEMRGAEGAKILLSGSIVFTHRDAIQIHAPLELTLAPDTESLRGAAILAHGDVELHADKRGPLVLRRITNKSNECAGVRTNSSVKLLGAGRMQFESLVGRAIWAQETVLFRSDGEVEFSNCTSRDEGGAVAARSVHFNGTGNYVFANCSSNFGGAIQAKDNITADRGNISFKNCTAKEAGSAMDAQTVMVSRDARVHLQSSGKMRSGGEFYDIFAYKVVIPPGGRVTARSINPTSEVLAKAEQDDNRCPAGSEFKLGEHEEPILGECTLCPLGYASVAPVNMQVRGEIGVISPDTKVVLVSKGSKNEMHFGLNAGHGPQPLTFGAMLNGSETFGQWGIYADLGANNSMKCGPASAAMNATYGKDGVIRINNVSVIAASYKGCYQNRDLILANATEELPRWNMEFNLDVNTGSLSPKCAPHLALGYGHDTEYSFQEACTLCSFASDKLDCEGGSHMKMRLGYMLIPENFSEKHELPELHRCPHARACPGGHFSAQEDGSPGIQDNICGEGYDSHSPGCTACMSSFGRTVLDPFVCKRCGDRWQVQLGVSRVVLSTAGLYLVSLRSAGTRNQAQQIFKMLLTFLTVAARCVATLQFSPYYLELKALSTSWASTLTSTLRKAISFVDILSDMEPGGSSSLLDCWYDRPLNTYENLEVLLKVHGGVFLVFVAVAVPWKGWQAGLTCWIIWSNLYLPPLTAAVMKFFPCIATTEEGSRLKIFAMHTNATCSSTWADLAQDQLLLSGCVLTIMLLLLGPWLWVHLTLKAGDLGIQESNAIHFLVSGYRDEVLWWEGVVLLRKMVIFAVAVFWPLSCSSRGYTLYLLAIVQAATLANVIVKPYCDPALNSLETIVLLISGICLVLVALMQIEWTLQDMIGCVVYFITLAVLLVLMFGTFVYLLFCYVSAGWIGTGGKAHPDAAEQESAEHAS